MKKQRRFFRQGVYLIASLMGAIVLSGCSKVSNPINAFKVMDNQEKMAKIDLNDLEMMLKQNREFILYVSDEYCSSCLKTTPTLNQFVKEENVSIYNYNFNDGYTGEERESIAFRALQNSRGEYPFQATDNMDAFYGTPSLYILQNGERIYEVSHNRLANYSTFKSTIKNYYNLIDIYEVSNIHDLALSLEENENFIISIFDGKSDDFVVNNNLISKCKETGKVVYFINTSICQNYNFPIDYGPLAEVSLLENSVVYFHKEKGLHQIAYNDDNALNLINQYFI